MRSYCKEIAARVPDRLKSLMLINTHAGGLSGIPPMQGLWTTVAGLLAPADGVSAGDRTKFGDAVYSDLHACKLLNDEAIKSWTNPRKLPRNEEVGSFLPQPPQPKSRQGDFSLYTFIV
jgi:hypothetical protein